MMLSQLKPLLQEERQLARTAAAEAVMRDIGEQPQRDHYNQHAAQRYPASNGSDRKILGAARQCKYRETHRQNKKRGQQPYRDTE